MAEQHTFVVEVGDMDDYHFVPEELVDHIDEWDEAARVVDHYPTHGVPDEEERRG